MLTFNDFAVSSNSLNNFSELAKEIQDSAF